MCGRLGGVSGCVLGETILLSGEIRERAEPVLSLSFIRYGSFPQQTVNCRQASLPERGGFRVAVIGLAALSACVLALAPPEAEILGLFPGFSQSHYYDPLVQSQIPHPFRVLSLASRVCACLGRSQSLQQ